MNVVIFGASGKIGSLTLRRALDRGHKVRAFVRDPGQIDINNVGLEVVEGDIYKPNTIEQALKGQDAVISALGGSITKGPLVCRDGVEAILPAMKKHGVKRLIALSAFGASEHAKFSPYARGLRLAIPLPMHDKDEMETIIKASDADWTIVRAGGFIGFWPKKKYRAAEVLGSPVPAIIPPAVADCLVDELETSDHLKKAIAIEGA